MAGYALEGRCCGPRTEGLTADVLWAWVDARHRDAELPEDPGRIRDSERRAEAADIRPVWNGRIELGVGVGSEVEISGGGAGGVRAVTAAAAGEEAGSACASQRVRADERVDDRISEVVRGPENQRVRFSDPTWPP